MALTKSHIVDTIFDRMHSSKNKSVTIVENLLEIIKSNLEQGNDVLISGFGKFCIKDKTARKGRNPATGKDLMLNERRVVTFKCSGKLRDKINNNTGTS